MLAPLTRRQAIGAFLFVLGLLIGGAWALGWIPAHAAICDEAGKAKNCASYNIFFYSAWQTIKFLDRYSALITAIATATIGIFTYTLKSSTDKLWTVAKDQIAAADNAAKIQSDDMKASIAVAKAAAEHIPVVERAWIFSGPGAIKQQEDGRIRFGLVVKNHGKTPGFVKVVWANVSKNACDSPNVTYEGHLKDK